MVMYKEPNLYDGEAGKVSVLRDERLMKQEIKLAAALALVSGAFAQTTAPEYGQCGGIGWTGATTCPAGWTCSAEGDYYSQVCLCNHEQSG